MNNLLTSLQDQRGLGGGGLGCDDCGRGGIPDHAGGGKRGPRRWPGGWLREWPRGRRRG